MISDFLERLFLGPETTSRDNVKSRLKIVLAQDRANLSPEMMEAMRQEIVEVVSRYVEIDTEGLNFSLESDQRVTALIANLPIRRIKFEPEAQAMQQSGMPIPPFEPDTQALPKSGVSIPPPPKPGPPPPKSGVSIPPPPKPGVSIPPPPKPGSNPQVEFPDSSDSETSSGSSPNIDLSL